jgi:hypothetical protein
MKYKKTTYIADMTKEDQMDIQTKLYRALEDDYSGSTLEDIVEGAMDSRLSDLEDTINIKPYVETKERFENRIQIIAQEIEEENRDVDDLEEWLVALHAIVNIEFEKFDEGEKVNYGFLADTTRKYTDAYWDYINKYGMSGQN